MTLPIPSHIFWSFNSDPYSAITNNPGDDFKFEYKIPQNLTIRDIKYEVQQALIRLHEDTNLKLSICVSGADSEIIAREAKGIGIPFEIYFLDIWNVNQEARKNVEQLSKQLSVPLNILSIGPHDLLVEVEKNLHILQAEKPTYLCLPYLLYQIPKDSVIVGGEGDPQKEGPDYEMLADADQKFPGIPISITEVYFKQWAKLNNRKCEMNFYSYTPELLMCYWNHPLLQNSNKVISTKSVIQSTWGNLLFQYKTTNWEKNHTLNYILRLYARSKNNKMYRFRPAVCLANFKSPL